MLSVLFPESFIATERGTPARSAYFGDREHPDRSIVNTQIGIVNTGIGDRERSVATLGVQASS